MTDYGTLLATLQILGFTDDSGNSIPTTEKRYCLTSTEITIGNGYHYVRFYFNRDGKFLKESYEH
jgi:hypothetical protein